jgi:Aspartyl/Asparaginyl beta-hydroxylase
MRLTLILILMRSLIRKADLVFGYLGHVRDCRLIRSLLRKTPSHNLDRLHWYNLPLPYVVSWRGILHVICWNIFRRRPDETARNHGFENLYFAEVKTELRAESQPTIWNHRGLSSKPWFDEISRTRELLELNSEAIIAEYDKVGDDVGTHPDNEIVADHGRWRALFLYKAGGEKNRRVCRLCPQTTSIVERLPLCRNFGFVLFSLLEPKTHLVAHTGSTNLRLRHHLGISIPDVEKSSIKVAAESRAWHRGECLAFDDSFVHEITNESNHPRVVLIVDTWHPSLTPDDILILGHPVFQSFGKTRGRLSRWFKLDDATG